jgi:inosine/xanthosine triphosphatase
MKKIVVASKNPVKVQAVLNGFQSMFPGDTFTIEGVSVHSSASGQPMSDAETYAGALERVTAVSKEVPDADFWVGIEAGVEEKESEMEVFAWAVVLSNKGRYGKGKTGVFFLPPKVVELIKQGKELSEADDIVFNRQNSKQTNGAVGILTGDVIDRTKYCAEAVVLALIPFKNEALYG